MLALQYEMLCGTTYSACDVSKNTALGVVQMQLEPHMHAEPKK